MTEKMNKRIIGQTSQADFAEMERMAKKLYKPEFVADRILQELGYIAQIDKVLSLLEAIIDIIARATTEARCIEAGIQPDNEPEIVEKAASEILKLIDKGE